MSRYWIGVASRDHVMTGVAGGFCQLGHGRQAPLRRLSPGDGLAYYAPRTGMRAGARIQAFVAIGQIGAGGITQVRQTADFCPFRRDIAYFGGTDAPIAGLKEHLSFTRDGANWGLLMRRGLFRVSRDDFLVIARAMGVGRAVSTAFPRPSDPPTAPATHTPPPGARPRRQSH